MHQKSHKASGGELWANFFSSVRVTLARCWTCWYVTLTASLHVQNSQDTIGKLTVYSTTLMQLRITELISETINPATCLVRLSNCYWSNY
eukprot:1898705-Amphidinium_carterae.1